MGLVTVLWRVNGNSMASLMFVGTAPETSSMQELNAATVLAHASYARRRANKKHATAHHTSRVCNADVLPDFRTDFAKQIAQCLLQ
jgi:hypothetical protein